MGFMRHIDQTGNLAVHRDRPDISVGDLVRVFIPGASFPGIVVQRDITRAAILEWPLDQHDCGFISNGNYGLSWYYFSQLERIN